MRSTQKNSFGLMPGLPPYGTCPGATTGEGGCAYVKPGTQTMTCYADQLSRMPAVKRVLRHNTELMRGNDIAGMVSILAAEFRRFFVATTKKGFDASTCKYRLHWSGDIETAEYAQALSIAVAMFPDIQFWLYTRSFTKLGIGHMRAIAKRKNVILFFSTDVENWNASFATFVSMDPAQYSGRLRIATMLSADDNAARIEALPERIRDAYKAYNPELTVKGCTTNGDDDDFIDACSRCGMCTRPGRAIVWFETRLRKGNKKVIKDGKKEAHKNTPVQLNESISGEHNTCEGSCMDALSRPPRDLRGDGAGCHACQGCSLGRHSDGAPTALHARAPARITTADKGTQGRKLGATTKPVRSHRSGAPVARARSKPDMVASTVSSCSGEALNA